MRSIFILLFLLAFSVKGQYTANWESLDKRPTPNWFEDAKFGIFIHWGIFSVPSWATKSNADGFGSGYSEWYWERLHTPKLKIHKEFTAFHKKNYGDASYQDFVQQFKAELYNPADWAQIFKNSGAKYVVLTSKHHEGFTLWPSKESWNWNAVDVGPHRDLAGDLSQAVKVAGLHMGFYYSLYEWYNPNYLSDVNQYVAERMIPQMKDLVTSYKPDILWTDGEWEHPASTWKSEEFLSWLFNDSPVKANIVVNDRWGNDTRGVHGSFATSEYGHGGTDNSETGDFQRPWEECRGMGESFGYNRNENLADYQSGKALIHELIDVVSRGGNFLLNIGPTADGRIPVIMQQRLQEIGDWLAVNGAAIYESRRWREAPEMEHVKFTQKGEKIYAIVTEWESHLKIPLHRKPKQVILLGSSDATEFNYSGTDLSITAPVVSPGSDLAASSAWVYEISF